MHPRTVLFALPFLLWTGVAHAATTLYTPWVFLGENQASQCNVTNVGTKPIAVSIELYDLLGKPVFSEIDNCTGVSLAPKATCGVDAGERRVMCVIKSSGGAVRGALTVYQQKPTFTPVVVVPATAK